MRRREPAQAVLIEDLISSTMEESIPDSGDTRDHYITLTGARVYRVLISGVLMEMDDIGSEGSPMVRMRVADPTGGISFTLGRYNPGLLRQVGSMSVPSFVTVIGRVTSFRSKSGGRVLTLNPEIITVCNKEEREIWHLAAVRDAMARLWTLESRGPFHSKAMDLPDIEEPRGGEEIIEKSRAMIQETLNFIDRSRFSRAFEEVRTRVKEGETEGEDADPLEQYEDQVLGMVEDLDSGSGARWDDLVDFMQRNKLSRDIVEEVVSNLLDKGLLYEPVLGYLKAI